MYGKWHTLFYFVQRKCVFLDEKSKKVTTWAPKLTWQPRRWNPPESGFEDWHIPCSIVADSAILRINHLNRYRGIVTTDQGDLARTVPIGFV